MDRLSASAFVRLLVHRCLSVEAEVAMRALHRKEGAAQKLAAARAAPEAHDGYRCQDPSGSDPDETRAQRDIADHCCDPGHECQPSDPLAAAKTSPQLAQVRR